MKEYEIVAKFYNACGGAAHAQTFFEEAELSSTDEYVLTKHGKDFEKFSRQIGAEGQVIYTYDNGSITYIYEFTEL